jgi:hypothetical protein
MWSCLRHVRSLAVASVLVLPGSSLAAAPASGPRFTEITADVGLDFVHESGAEGGLEVPEIMGGGCAFLDYDADGDLDIYLTNGSFASSAPDPPRNRLFRQDADGRFADVTTEAGVGDPAYGMGIAVGDFDGDGALDLYVTNFGPDRLYRNRGDGTFEDVAERAGIAIGGWSCSAAFLDYDADGDLDLFVTQYVELASEKECTDSAGRPEYCGPKEFPPLSDVLLRNEGDGTFADVSTTAGMGDVAAAGLGVTCEDFDEDGRLDVYVANDAYANHLWLNQGGGEFVDDALLLGAAFNQQGMAEAGMGVVAADFDEDLDFDLFMTHLRNETNTLYFWEGVDLGYEDRTADLGLGAGSMPTTGFGTAAFDVELDGDLDLFVGNGSVNRGEPWPGANVPPPWDRYAEPNHLWINDAGRFSLAGPQVGSILERVEVTRGVAAGDVDADGDLDILLVNVQGPARLYRNDAPRQGRWLLVRPVEAEGGAVALGATVTVRAGSRQWLRAVAAGVSYLSSSDPRAHFGLGESDRVDEIVVRWADGARESFAGGAVDREAVVVRGQGRALP